MKPFLIIAFSLICTLGMAQAPIGAKVNKALSNGNAASLKEMMMPEVDFSLLDEEGMFPADQVVKMLASFFKEHPVSGFEVKHKGTSKLDDHYRIGELSTKSGLFRITYFLKNTPKGVKIKQLRIESADD